MKVILPLGLKMYDYETNIGRSRMRIDENKKN